MQTSIPSHTQNDPEGGLARLRFATRNFNDLRGLRTLWLGLAFVMYGLSEGAARYGDYLHDLRLRQWPYVRGWDQRLLDSTFDVSAVAALTLVYGFIPVMFLLKRYYRERFPWVSQVRARIAFMPVLLLTFVISEYLPWQPGARVYAMFGLAWIAVGLYRPQRSLLALGVAVLALAAAPPFFPPALWSVNKNLSLILCGLVCAVVGLLDHRQLVRILGQADGGGQAPPAELRVAPA